MYVLSFRIPYNVFGRRAYVNGSALVDKNIPRKQVFVSAGCHTRLLAEVIDTRPTRREADSFKWKVVP